MSTVGVERTGFTLGGQRRAGQGSICYAQGIEPKSIELLGCPGVMDCHQQLGRLRGMSWSVLMGITLSERQSPPSSWNAPQHVILKPEGVPHLNQLSLPTLSCPA